MKHILNKLFAHQQLTRGEAKDVLSKMAQGLYNDSQIVAFMTVFLMRSISVDEFWGFVDAMLEQKSNLTRLSAYNPIDIVGTGGDGKNTFNISTLACFVVAAAGYKVAKHGNYGATSVSGASTVMEQLGVRFTRDVDKLEQSLDKSNLAFLHAPLFNDTMKVVAPLRKDLGVRSFFNMLGPIVNPIRPQRAVLGVFNLRMSRMYHYSYQQTNIDYSIVHSMDGYDEISLTDNFKITTRLNEKIYAPEQFSFVRYNQQALSGGISPKDAAVIFRNVINNEATQAQKDVVIINAAVAIHTINPLKTLQMCITEAEEVFNNGKLRETFQKFLTLNS